MGSPSIGIGMQADKRDSTDTIGIVVNGEPREVSCGQTLAGLLAELGLDGGRVAIELDRAIVRQSEWAATRLREGSAVEIVHFVGGG